MADSDRDRRITEALGSAIADELSGAVEDQPWFYLSFADEEFLGGAYVQAGSEGSAWARASLLGINPGGEVQIVGPIPREALDENVPEDQRERLLSREEVEGEPGGR